MVSRPSIPLHVHHWIDGNFIGLEKAGKIYPPTQKGISSDASKWLRFDEIQQIAATFVADSLQENTAIDRIDVRPSKGIAKVKFKEHYHEVQVDLTTGEILSVEKRWNDFIEQIHDGTIVDRFLGTDGDPVKIIYTTLTSLGLMLLSFSGFFLWLNPRRIRRIKGLND